MSLKLKKKLTYTKSNINFVLHLKKNEKKWKLKLLKNQANLKVKILADLRVMRNNVRSSKFSSL